MNRVSIKVAGQSGQGINVVGEILAKAFKRAGFYTFAYREYPSLIKGGHATYQVDISDQKILAANKMVNILVVFNRQATKWYLEDLKENSVIIHTIDNPRINSDELKIITEKNIKLIYIPALQISIESGGNDVTSNIVAVGALWSFFNQQFEIIYEIVRKTFEDKPKFLEIDLKCVEAGYKYNNFGIPPYTKRLIKAGEVSSEEKSKVHLTGKNLDEEFKNFSPNEELKNNYLMTGNEAMALGAINAGVRIYYAYPMTPTSAILDYFADHSTDTGMIVKQVEDEITAAAMAIGSMHMGTRALTGTSGGGFDLMAEHVSLAGSIEVPFVCILGQRPGPATGMPTWTTQGDLFAAIYSGHGEFSRCVIGTNNAEDSFYTIQEALNISEKYQIPVIVLTDKYIAESIFQVSDLNTEKIKIDRGELANDPEGKRYKFTESGVSSRWFPGDEGADFNANSDEHDEFGNVTEESEPSKMMIEKRILKEETLKSNIPDPIIYSNNPAAPTKEINLLGWGSSFTVASDLMSILQEENIKVNYMDIKYLWPLKVEKITEYINQDNVILIEGNYNSQLKKLIKMETGIDIKNTIRRWDGRPFFADELAEQLKSI